MRALLLVAAACGTVASEPDAPPANADGAGPDGATDASTGTGILGDLCRDDGDCASAWSCVYLSTGDPDGICTQTCTSTQRCRDVYGNGPGVPFCSGGVFDDDRVCLIRCGVASDCPPDLTCTVDAVCRPPDSQPENLLGASCGAGVACATSYTCVDFGNPPGFCTQGCTVSNDPCALHYTGPGAPVCSIDLNGDGLSDHCEISCTGPADCPSGLQCINLGCTP